MTTKPKTSTGGFTLFKGTASEVAMQIVEHIVIKAATAMAQENPRQMATFYTAMLGALLGAMSADLGRPALKVVLHDLLPTLDDAPGLAPSMPSIVSAALGISTVNIALTEEQQQQIDPLLKSGIAGGATIAQVWGDGIRVRNLTPKDASAIAMVLRGTPFRPGEPLSQSLAENEAVRGAAVTKH